MALVVFLVHKCLLNIPAHTAFAVGRTLATCLWLG